MDAIKNLDELLKILKASILDISECEEDLNIIEELNSKVDKSEIERLRNFRRRNYIRTVFSSIEGILFAMKRIILEDIDSKTNIIRETSFGLVLEEKESELNTNDIICLQEYKFVGASSEKLERINVNKSFNDNFIFTFRKYEQTRVKSYHTDFGCKQWEIFQEAIKIRNRITHPKLSSDLEISEEEFNCVKSSYNWFNEILHKLQKEEYS